MGFVFFDTETTGLKLGFDQIVHFAAIRTDNELNEVERFEARSRLLPHVVPHPTALKTNGISIGRLTDSSLPSHYAMMRAVRQKLLEWSPSIFVGYNSIRFDEEMLRHALFQTLHSAYLTSNHGNCRADVLSLVMAAAAVTPACLTVPIGAEGRATFRLDQLAVANQVAHPMAHDAMADAEATLGLSRCVYERSSELWQRFVRFSKKATVADFVGSDDGFILTEFFGNEAYHTPVVYIGTVPDQPNARLCLTIDDAIVGAAASDDEQLRLELSRKPCPVRRLRVNAAPTLTALYDASKSMLGGATIEQLEAQARRIKNDTDLCARIVSAYLATREPWPPSRHVEERTHDGFPGPQDEGRMAAFHGASGRVALELVSAFEDERLRALGLRLIYFHARLSLPENIRRDLDRTLTDRLVETDAGGLTLHEALAETDKLLSDGAAADHEDLLTEYRAYLLERIARVTEFRAKHCT